MRGDDAPPDRATNRPSRASRAVAWVALALLAVVGTAVTISTQHTAVLGADASEHDFSADRAAATVADVVAAPRVPGTVRHAQARDMLVAALDDLGFDTVVEQGVAWSPPREPDATDRGARTANIVATLPGTDSTGTLVLAAHYDTVAGSPGASDDGLGLATVLEAARALVADGPHRNTITVLVTDGEEAGLLGARAFVTDPPPSPVVVLNHEARGATGTPIVFRTGSPNGGIVRTLASVPGAVADSSGESAFSLLPNSTDFTVFTEAGFTGYDTAITASSAYYHSPVDSAEHRSPESLQRMGSVALGTARSLAATDLTTVTTADRRVVISVFGGLWHIPRGAEYALAALTVALALLLVVVRVRSGDGFRRILACAGISSVATVVAAGAAELPWFVGRRLDPGQASAVVGEPYRPGGYQVAAVAAAVTVLVVAAVGLRRRCGATEVATAVLGCAALATGIAAAVPGAAFLLSIVVAPALVGALVAPTVAPPVLRTVVYAVAALPAVVVATPYAIPFLDLGLLLGTPLLAIVVAVIVAATYPLLDAAVRVRPTTARRAGVVALGVCLVVASTVVGAVQNRAGATPDRQQRLGYLVDADTGDARYLVVSPHADWARDLARDDLADDPRFAMLSSDPASLGPAPGIAVSGPTVQVVSDVRTDVSRTVEVTVRTTRDAAWVGMWMEPGVVPDSFSVDGHALAPRDGAGFRLDAAREARVSITVPDSDSALRLRIADGTPTLAEPAERAVPDGWIVVSPQTVVTRGVTV